MSPNNVSPLQAFTNKKLTNMTIRSKNLPFTVLCQSSQATTPVLWIWKFSKNQEAFVTKISKNPKDWIKPIGVSIMWEKPRNLGRSLFREHPTPQVLLPYTNHLCAYSYLVATNCITFSPTNIVTIYRIGYQGRTWDQGSPSPKTGQHRVLDPRQKKKKRKEWLHIGVYHSGLRSYR